MQTETYTGNPGVVATPVCFKCSTAMSLVHSKSDSDGIELRLFHCPNCGTSVEWVFKAM